MEINEVFPNPTVKQVIWQIRFPTLFYLENHMGEFQFKVIEAFPDSKLLFRQKVVLVDVGPETKLEKVNQSLETEGTVKIWQFSSPNNYKLNVTADTLDITSEYHKTYDNKMSENRFRDIIEFTLHHFKEVMKVTLLARVGLRYIDTCPIPSKTNDVYRQYFNTAFNLDKFPVETSTEMDYKTVVKKGDYYLRYIESIRHTENGDEVILDFDAFATKVKTTDCLAVTDRLHQITKEEFQNTINQPVIDYMRRQDGARIG